MDEATARNVAAPIGKEPSVAFWVAKPTQAERPKVDGVFHPTVKPLQLMRRMIRLVTQPYGLVLDPFAGSGTALEACMQEGVRAIGIERDETYVPLIRARVHRQGSQHHPSSTGHYLF